LRRFLSLLGVAAAIPVFLAVPVIARPAVAPHPVTPHVADVVVTTLPSVRGVVADSGPRATKPFTLVGAAWHTGSLAPSATIEVRTHDAGHWSSWSALELPDGGPDGGSQDAKAAAARHVSATEPLWVGSADGVQARVVNSSGARTSTPAGLHVVLVDGGSSSADASPGPARPLGGAVAEAAQAQPTIYTRSQWGADESLRKSSCPKGPDYSSTIKMGFVHHTDGPNGYTQSQVPSIIRSIYAYHVKSNGWCDVGYNFLVDRFGRIWEGRYGGISKAVIGAHTGGFNTNSFGVSLIGTFSSVTPSAAMLSGVEKVFAWKLGMYYRDPSAKTTLVAASFSGSRFATGSTVTFNVISGHRDADSTTCPGSAAYAKLATIRAGVKSLIGAGFVAPSISPSSVRMLSGQKVAIHAGLLSPQTWTATVTDAKGATVKTWTGTAATAAAGVSTVWDGTTVDGVPAPPGSYRITLTGANSAGSENVPYSAPVTVTPPVTVTGPATATYGANVTLKGTAAPGAAVTATLQPAKQGSAAEVRQLTASSAGAWSTTFPATDDYSWSAAVPGYTTPTSTTVVTPDVTAPTMSAARSLLVAQGSRVALSGNGLPGTTLQAMTTPRGGSTTTGSLITVRPDGTWSGVTVKPSVPTTVVLQRSSTVKSAPITVFPVAAPTAVAPAKGYAQRAFRVTGNAGAPVSVQLWTQPAGASSYSLVKTVTAASSGAYSVAGTLPSTTKVSSTAWKVVSTAGSTTFGSAPGSISVQPLFAPTSTGTGVGYYRGVVTVTGRAVPGDAATLWTKPATSGSWTRVSSVTANATTGAYSRSFTLLRDTVWRVTSPTGTTATRTTVVRPSLHVPSRAKLRTIVYISGTALPGQKVAVYRRSVGTAKWNYFATVTAASTGRWTSHFRFTHAINVLAGSHGHYSPGATIRVA
jgi:hypothetical protein